MIPEKNEEDKELQERKYKELRKKIIDGKITKITLDTTIFDSCDYSFESSILKLLKQFRNSPIQFVLSDIIVKEIKSHLIK
ncbi:PIN domain-containing protein, partial [Spirulina sp. 06S082]|uniref:PIN domain-containing protein n=1 Tax=Spirulina sp. 06S082 TaxID=3110248 RepID=UPI002B20BD3B